MLLEPILGFFIWFYILLKEHGVMQWKRKLYQMAQMHVRGATSLAGWGRQLNGLPSFKSCVPSREILEHLWKLRYESDLLLRCYYYFFSLSLRWDFLTTLCFSYWNDKLIDYVQLLCFVLACLLDLKIFFLSVVDFEKRYSGERRKKFFLLFSTINSSNSQIWLISVQKFLLLVSMFQEVGDKERG